MARTSVERTKGPYDDLWQSHEELLPKIRRILEANLLVKSDDDRINQLLVGLPGSGKSLLAARAAREALHRILKRNACQDLPCDAKGLGARDMDNPGQATFLMYGGYRELMDATEPTVCIIEDLALGDKMLAGLHMAMFHDRLIFEGRRVSDKVSFIATTNDRADLGMCNILPPVKERCQIWYVRPDGRGVCHWLADQGVDERLISYLMICPASLESLSTTKDLVQRPTPRNWHRVARLLACGCDSIKDFAGSVGYAEAVQFHQHLNTVCTLPTNPQAILLNPSTEPVPSEPHMKWILTVGLARNTTINNFDRSLEYLSRCGKVFEAFGVQMITRSVSGVSSTSAWRKWALENQDILDD